MFFLKRKTWEVADSGCGFLYIPKIYDAYCEEMSGGIYLGLWANLRKVLDQVKRHSLWWGLESGGETVATLSSPPPAIASSFVLVACVDIVSRLFNGH